MRVLFVAAEAAPIAKVGGMGDVVGTLPQALRDLGHDVRILMPYYGTLPDKMDVPEKHTWQGTALGKSFEIFEATLPGTEVPLYLLGNAAFAPKYVYGSDDDWRFAFFSRAAAVFCEEFWSPQVVHCHDWHTGLIPVYLADNAKFATVYTVHNLAYQGPARVRLEEIDPTLDRMRGHNAMSAAIYHADRVNAVSPTYARQIQTPEYGEGLQELLTAVSDKTIGIVNGIDPVLYDPATDRKIYQNYTVETIEKRAANKPALQGEVGLTVDPNMFLIGMVSRLVEQKGLDLVLQVIETFLSYTPSQVVILGTGDRQYESRLWDVATRFPGRMSVQLLYNDTLARRIYAGADGLLMPSRFEPCGISQMFAMRYGCIPLVRSTGGLADTVSHHDPIAGAGTGYCFLQYNAMDFYTCLVRSMEAYNFKAEWQALQKRAMSQDLSWKQSAAQYVDLYEAILPERATP